MIRRIAPIALMAALAACAAASPTGTVPKPEASSAALQPSDSAMPQPSEAAELRRVSVAELLAQPDPLSAFGGTQLSMDVGLASVGAVDCPTSSGLQPDFFHCSHWVFVGTPGGDYPTPETAVFAVLHPAIAELGESAVDQLVTVTAHYDDPAASTCRLDPYEGPAPEPAPDEVVFDCRSTLVITEIHELRR